MQLCLCHKLNWNPPISLEPDGVNLNLLGISNLDYLIYQNLYLRATTLGCEEIGIRKSQFAIKT